MKLVRVINKDTLMVAARDYVLLSCMAVEGESISFVCGSIEDSSYVPEDNYIRGDIKIMGVRITPTKDDKVTVVIVSMIDYKEDIPDKIKLKLGRQQAAKIHLILSSLKKRLGR